MAAYEDHVTMIRAVATKIGPELCQSVAFVGGCTTALFITDRYAFQQVRHTDDVDVIVHVIGMAGWYALAETLRQKGFKDNMLDDGPLCALSLQGMRVDFMPDDSEILGFTNRWYRDALKTAVDHDLGEGIVIRLVQPAYFVATKLEAFLGRGNDDLLSSQDSEDIFTLIDGRSELLEEIRVTPKNMRDYVASELLAIKKNRNFDYALQDASNGDRGRDELIRERIDLLISYGDLA